MATSILSPMQSRLPSGHRRPQPPSRTNPRRLTAVRPRAPPRPMPSAAACPVASEPPAAAEGAAGEGEHPSLARVWRDIHGSNNWEGLVDPLHPLLRDELIRYGELVGACYSAFDADPSSKRHLNSKYGRRSMMSEVGMGASGYEVTKYVYATPGVTIPMQREAGRRSRWVGYVAVASDEQCRRLGRRDLLVSFRGTVTASEWVANLMSALTPARLHPTDPRPDVKVEWGFLSTYTSDGGGGASRFGPGSCREQVLSELSSLMSKYRHEEMSITLVGHSMGSSLATLAGYDLAELGMNRDAAGREVPVAVYSYGGPRVGNWGFMERCDELGVKVLRVVNANDPVTRLPGFLLNENTIRVWGGDGGGELPWSGACYAHVGVEVAVALEGFRAQDPACAHDMETYLRLLGGSTTKLVQVQREEEGVDLLRKAGESWSENRFCSLMWQDVAIKVGDLMQLLGI